MSALQSTAGNGAASRMVEQQRHEQDTRPGQQPAGRSSHDHADPVQRAQAPQAGVTVQRAGGGSTPPPSAQPGGHNPPVQQPQQSGPTGQQNPQNAPTPIMSPEQVQAIVEQVKSHFENEFIRLQTPELANWSTEANQSGAYRTMVDKGQLWKDSRQVEPSAQTGRAFVAEKSQKNLSNTWGEAVSPGGDWQVPIYQKMLAALNTRVLHHYTTSDRIGQMLGSDGVGEMKSKDKLTQEDPSKKNDHNTQQIDVDHLANTGFVYFFIAKDNAPFRDTRFAAGKGKPARIVLPMAGMIQDGWIMMNDFIDQENPTVRADKDGNSISYKRDIRDPSVPPEDRKHNSPEAKMELARDGIRQYWKNAPDLDKKAHDLAHGLAQSMMTNAAWSEQTKAITDLAQLRKDASAEFAKQLKNNNAFKLGYDALAEQITAQSKKAAQFNRQVRRFDPDPYLLGGTMRHMHGAGTENTSNAQANMQGAVKRYKEHLHGNILAGSHILPGLAARGVLEIARMEAAGGNEPMVARMKNMSGDALVDMLLKDYVRPQVMIPWSVGIKQGDVQYKS
ncbi:hypothetical protein [Streptomyces sp. NPDC088746]|uniref:hypothetical protein n=1 Tax=Streptomyces sp. NPDC088746 TaxID=3365885 RepID=UPI00380BEAB0